MRALACAAALAWTGCGYAFVGRGTPLPTGGKRIFTPTFANVTSEAGVEALFTEAFREELANAGVEGPPGSPVEAHGQVNGIGGGPSLLNSFGPTGALGEPASPSKPTGEFFASYHVDANVCVTLVEGSTQLASACVGGSEDYAPAQDPLGVEANRRTALRRLVKRLMRDCVERLSTGF